MANSFNFIQSDHSGGHDASIENMEIFQSGTEENPNSKNEINAVVEVLRTTTQMSKNVREFEAKVAQKYEHDYGVMVNSGSSANLLATFAAGNPLKKNCLKRGDEVLIPALCWSTSIWPLVQFGLKPVFVDIDIDTFCIDTAQIEAAITPATKVIIPVHEFGLMADMAPILEIAKKHKLLVIEDAACALGASET